MNYDANLNEWREWLATQEPEPKSFFTINSGWPLICLGDLNIHDQDIP